MELPSAVVRERPLVKKGARSSFGSFGLDVSGQEPVWCIGLTEDLAEVVGEEVAHFLHNEYRQQYAVPSSWQHNPFEEEVYESVRVDYTGLEIILSEAIGYFGSLLFGPRDDTFTTILHDSQREDVEPALKARLQKWVSDGAPVLELIRSWSSIPEEKLLAVQETYGCNEQVSLLFLTPKNQLNAVTEIVSADFNDGKKLLHWIGYEFGHQLFEQYNVNRENTVTLLHEVMRRSNYPVSALALADGWLTKQKRENAPSSDGVRC